MAADSVVIDYIVFYTPAAEARVGGESVILERISTAVSGVNATLVRSGLSNISYNLVHVQRLIGDSTLNDAVVLLNDAIQEVYQSNTMTDIRDEYQADAVSIIFDRITPGAYGSIPLNARQAHSSFTYFGVFNYTPNTVAHELGHNMGGNHNNNSPEEGYDGTTSWYGYNFEGTDGIYYRTIMSYGYPDSTPATVPIAYYSNPEIMYEGHATGKEGYADMASTIRYWAPFIANTYYTTPPSPPPVVEVENKTAPRVPLSLLLDGAQ